MKKAKYLANIREIQQEVISNEQAIADHHSDILEMRAELVGIIELQEHAQSEDERLEVCVRYNLLIAIPKFPFLPQHPTVGAEET
jgi:hypothetical protein